MKNLKVILKFKSQFQKEKKKLKKKIKVGYKNKKL